MKDVAATLPDAFREPQRVRPGCMHQLGCKCVPPYHLRASTSIEEAREEFLRRPFIFPTTASDMGTELAAGDGPGLQGEIRTRCSSPNGDGNARHE